MTWVRDADVIEFWKKVEKTDHCWIWHGSEHAKGYGCFSHQGHSHLAHRVAWQLTYGGIPENKRICHHCDNPACVRPVHLFQGTDADNTADRIAKRRPTRPGACPGVRRRSARNIPKMFYVLPEERDLLKWVASQNHESEAALLRRLIQQEAERLLRTIGTERAAREGK